MKLAIFDFDGTLLAGNSWQLLFWRAVATQRMAGGKLLAALALRKTGLLGSSVLKRMTLQLLACQPAEVFEVWCADFNRRVIAPRLRPRALAEVGEVRRQGFEPVLATGAFDFVAEPFCTEHGIRHLVCTRVERDGGKLTGRILGEECRGPLKLRAIVERFGNGDVDWAASRLYSDNNDDGPLFSRVGEGYFVVEEPSAAVPPGLRSVCWR